MTAPGADLARTAAMAALALAVVGTAGSLYLSLGMRLKACPLCFYQRTFVMAVLAVLGLGLWHAGDHSALLCVLSLPLAVGGLGVALFHESLVLNGTLECPAGVGGLGSAPLQSVVLFIPLTLLVIWGAWQFAVRSAVVVGVVLGAILAVACVASAPPLPPAPQQPYPNPPEICRPPYRGS